MIFLMAREKWEKTSDGVEICRQQNDEKQNKLLEVHWPASQCGVIAKMVRSFALIGVGFWSFLQFIPQQQSFFYKRFFYLMINKFKILSKKLKKNSTYKFCKIILELKASYILLYFVDNYLLIIYYCEFQNK